MLMKCKTIEILHERQLQNLFANGVETSTSSLESSTNSGGKRGEQTWERKRESSNHSKDLTIEGLCGLVGLEFQLASDGLALGDLATDVFSGVAIVHRDGDDFSSG